MPSAARRSHNKGEPWGAVGDPPKVGLCRPVGLWFFECDGEQRRLRHYFAYRHEARAALRAFKAGHAVGINGAGGA